MYGFMHRSLSSCICVRKVRAFLTLPAEKGQWPPPTPSQRKVIFCNTFWENSSSSDSPPLFPFMDLAHVAPFHSLLVQSNTAFPLSFLTSFCSFSFLMQSQSLPLILLSRESGTREERWMDGSGVENTSPFHPIFSTLSVAASCYSPPLGSLFLSSSPQVLLSPSHNGKLVWVFLTGQIEVSLLPLLMGQREGGGGVGVVVQGTWL